MTTSCSVGKRAPHKPTIELDETLSALAVGDSNGSFLRQNDSVSVDSKWEPISLWTNTIEVRNHSPCDRTSAPTAKSIHKRLFRKSLNNAVIQSLRQADSAYIARRLTSRGAFSAMLGKHLEPKGEVNCTFGACSQLERGLRIHQPDGQIVIFYPLLLEEFGIVRVLSRTYCIQLSSSLACCGKLCAHVRECTASHCICSNLFGMLFFSVGLQVVLVPMPERVTIFTGLLNLLL